MSEYKPVPTHILMRLTKKGIVNEYQHALNIKADEAFKVGIEIQELEKQLAESVSKEDIENLIKLIFEILQNIKPDMSFKYFDKL